MKENPKATNFEPHECVILVPSMKIGTHKKNKTIHRMLTDLSDQGHKNNNTFNE